MRQRKKTKTCSFHVKTTRIKKNSLCSLQKMSENNQTVLPTSAAAAATAAGTASTGATNTKKGTEESEAAAVAVAAAGAKKKKKKTKNQKRKQEKEKDAQQQQQSVTPREEPAVEAAFEDIHFETELPIVDTFEEQKYKSKRQKQKSMSKSRAKAIMEADYVKKHISKVYSSQQQHMMKQQHILFGGIENRTAVATENKQLHSLRNAAKSSLNRFKEDLKNPNQNDAEQKQKTQEMVRKFGNMVSLLGKGARVDRESLHQMKMYKKIYGVTPPTPNTNNATQQQNELYKTMFS